MTDVAPDSLRREFELIHWPVPAHLVCKFGSWTDNPILRKWPFCNTFRVLDKLSQFIIREVIETGSQEPKEIVFRVLLFNSFTKIQTYKLLQEQVGPISWATYDRDKYECVLDQAREEGTSLYTGSFQKPAPNFGREAAFKNHLDLLEVLMCDDLAGRLAKFVYMADAFEHLASYPGLGDFTAYQLLLNLSYSSVINFSESDFVVAGIGAHSGLSKLFGNSMKKAIEAVPGIEIDVMRWLQKTQGKHFQRLGLEFSGLGPKRLPMQLCDVEHALCEVDKYARLAHPNIRGLHGRVNIRKKLFNPSPDYPRLVCLPKAWSHPARSVVCIKPGGPSKIIKRYVVSHINGQRENSDGLVEYLVYWWGYTAEAATWEPAAEVMSDAPNAIAEYMERLGKGAS